MGIQQRQMAYLQTKKITVEVLFAMRAVSTAGFRFSSGHQPRKAAATT